MNEYLFFLTGIFGLALVSVAGLYCLALGNLVGYLLACADLIVFALISIVLIAQEDAHG
jgi:hypothetical protein